MASKGCSRRTAATSAVECIQQKNVINCWSWKLTREFRRSCLVVFASTASRQDTTPRDARADQLARSARGGTQQFSTGAPIRRKKRKRRKERVSREIKYRLLLSTSQRMRLQQHQKLRRRRRQLIQQKSSLLTSQHDWLRRQRRGPSLHSTTLSVRSLQ